MSEYKPEWVKKLETLGEDLEKKYGSSRSDSNDKESECHTDNCEEVRKPEWRKYGNPPGDLFGQLISYLVITYVPAYFPDFFQTGWSAVYPVLLYVILIHVVVDFIQILIKARPIYYLGQVITNIASVVSMVVIVTIFPFNFPGNVDIIVQFGLWIAIAVVSIVSFFEFFKIFGLDSQ